MALGEIGDKDAVKFLINNFTDWYSNESVAEALVKLEWKPQTENERIHFCVAKRNGGRLRKNWELAKNILLDDVGSNNIVRLKTRCSLLLVSEKRDIISQLIDKLNKEGNKRQRRRISTAATLSLKAQLVIGRSSKDL